MLCSSVPRIALLYELPIKLIFAPFTFLTWRRRPCLRQKVNDRGKIRLITGKPACIGRFVLFCAFQSAESCRISHLENKNALIAG